MIITEIRFLLKFGFKISKWGFCGAEICKNLAVDFFLRRPRRSPVGPPGNLSHLHICLSILNKLG